MKLKISFKRKIEKQGFTNLMRRMSLMDLRELLKHLESEQWKKKNYPVLNTPILKRADVQAIKPRSGALISKTSGSTGIPVEVERTNLSLIWWMATNIREALWHKRDISQSFAVIRPSILKEGYQDQWGDGFSLLGRTGPLYAHPVKGDLNAWLQKIQPGYLTTYPSILKTIDLQALTNLKGIKTTGETLNFKNPLIADMYSTEEVGTIAIQCPENVDVLHVMENIIVEILDEDDKPAQIGRVVVTDLTSTYLYRYDIGDYAEFGKCTCGRGLQTIKKIMGRKRNKVVLPDGSSHWPRVGSYEYRKVAPIKRYQVAQVGRTTLEARLVVDHPLNEEQKQKITKMIQDSIFFPFTVNFVYVDEFPPGKFEEFVNEYSKSAR